MLLNGVQSSPFAQLISEHPEKADTITLVECPFYIGTVKNQMNYSLSCPVISRYHAKIEKLGGIYYINDLNSTNGTFVNGRRLKAEEPNVLIAGDKVAFANICFIFACPNLKYEI
jgi:pSer/pThr/pTyr-binding forkhead associated (FHA) protein